MTMSVATISQSSDRMIGFLAPLLAKMAPDSTFSLPADLGNDSRVLVIDSGELTEILFFAPVLDNLKTRYPGMRVTFLVREGNSELVRTMSHVNEMISYEPAHLSLKSTTYLALLKRIRDREFNVAFLLGTEFNLARSYLALLTRARIRVGFSTEHAFPFINCEVRPASELRYEGTKARVFLTALGMNGWDESRGWSLPEADLRWAKQMIHFHKPEKGLKLVAVDPGLGKGRHRLVDQSFAYLVKQLSRRMNCKVLVLSNNLDKKRLDQFRAELDAQDLFGVRPQNVKEGLALLSGVDLLIAGNTDYFHFGVAMRIPTIGLFTRHDTPNWFPKGTPWVQILQGVKGQRLSLEEFNSKIDTLVHLARVE
jgi:ADP-heptose:LPS heptosyltransferase